MHLTVSSNKNDFLVLGVIIFLRVPRLLFPALDECTNLLLEVLEKPFSSFGFLEFAPEFFGDSLGALFFNTCASMGILLLLLLLVVQGTRSNGGIPERSQIIRHSVLWICRMDLPVTGQRWLGPRIV